MFGDAVLLGSVGGRKVWDDAGLLTVPPEVSRTIFTTDVGAQTHNSTTVRDGKILNEAHKRVNRFGLATDAIKLFVPRKLIGELAHIHVSSFGYR